MIIGDTLSYANNWNEILVEIQGLTVCGYDNSMAQKIILILSSSQRVMQPEDFSNAENILSLPSFFIVFFWINSTSGCYK